MLCKKFNHLWLEIKIGIEILRVTEVLVFFDFLKSIGDDNEWGLLLLLIFGSLLSLGHHPLLLDMLFENPIPGAEGFIDQV